jgi:hypothetical protein
MAFVVVYVAILLLEVILSVFANSSYYFAAKALGGKGGASTQFYVMCAQSAPLSMLFVALNILSAIPIVGLAVMVLWLAAFLYDSYLKVKILKQVHSLDTTKAIACWLAPIAVLIVLAVFLFAAILALGFAAYAAKPS